MDIQYFGKRNYGCRIREYTADGLRCVSLENNLVRVGILLDKGADIFEFVYKPRDVDFMFTSPLPFAKNIIPTSANPAGNFMDYYEGCLLYTSMSLWMTLRYGPTRFVTSSYVPTLPGTLLYLEELAGPLVAECN